MKTISAALALWPIWRSPCNEMLFTYFEIPFFSPVCRSFLSGALYFAPKPTTNLDWNACLLSVRSIPSTYSILALELGSHRPKSTKILIRGYYHGVTEDWRWTDPEAMRLVQRKNGGKQEQVDLQFGRRGRARGLTSWTGKERVMLPSLLPPVCRVVDRPPHGRSAPTSWRQVWAPCRINRGRKSHGSQSRSSRETDGDLLRFQACSGWFRWRRRSRTAAVQRRRRRWWCGAGRARK